MAHMALDSTSICTQPWAAPPPGPPGGLPPAEIHAYVPPIPTVISRTSDSDWVYL